MSVLSAEQRQEIEAIVRGVAERVKDFEGAMPESWNDLSLANGLPSLCLLYGELDRRFPEEEWDLVGHKQLVKIQQALSQQPVNSPALWGGLAGLVMGVRALSRGGSRYGTMCAQLEAALESMTRQALPFLEAKLAEGDLQLTHYDAIAGLAGVGRVLLLLGKEQPKMLALLEDVLKYLVRLTATREWKGVETPGWHIKREHQFLEQEKLAYPNGNFNLGLSHGITGPMALMTLALRDGVEVPGQRESVRRIGEWLLAWKAEDEYGILWPGRISWEQFLAGELEERPPHQESWCYGAPGIARVLWMAGEVLGEDGWMETAVEAYRATGRRPEARWGIASPTFCHGYGGLLHLTQLMYEASGLEDLAESRDRFLKKVIGAYDESLPFGYADLAHATQGEGRPRQIHSAGLLDGAAGVALVLLNLLSAEKPSWDAVFLIR